MAAQRTYLAIDLKRLLGFLLSTLYFCHIWLLSVRDKTVP